MNEQWETAMLEVIEAASLLQSCNVEEIHFSSGHTLDLYIALTPKQRSKGLSCLNYLDTSGMLFCYEEPTYVPYSMKNTFLDLDIAWYDSDGSLIQRGTYYSGDGTPLTCPTAFSFVIEAPAGSLPSGSFKLGSSNGQTEI